MGLDMTVYAVDFDVPKLDYDVGNPRLDDDDYWDSLPEATDPQWYKDGVEELYYWRMHADLHGFISNLYEYKGGLEMLHGFMDMTGFRLDEEDLDAIEQALLGSGLPFTNGAYFRADKHTKHGAGWYDNRLVTRPVELVSIDAMYSGANICAECHSQWAPFWRESTLEFLDKARQALSNGKKLIYRASW